MSYRQHLEEYHEMHNGDPSIDTLVHAGVSSMTQSDRPCPFCYTEYENINDMHLHIAYHLERFSIFALPRSHHLDKDEDMNDGEAGSNDANTQRDQSLDEGDGTEKSSLAFKSQPSRNESSAAHSVTAEELRTDTHATGDQRELPMANGLLFALQMAEAEAAAEGLHQMLEISQFTEAQLSALQAYTSVTDQEILAAIPVLQRAKWNVSIAISRFFDGEPASDSPAEAVEVLQGTEGEERLDTSSTMADLAFTYLNQGRLTEAEKLQIQVMDMRRRVLGQEHPDTLSIMADLASTYLIQGQATEAEDLQMQVMNAKRRVLGQEHPDTLNSMHNLAMILSDQAKYEQAEEMYRQALELRKKVLGQEHPDTLHSMHNLAVILSDQGKHEQAEEVHRQALQAKRDGTGQRSSNHTDEHEQPGVSTEPAGQVRGGGRDAPTNIQAERGSIGQRVSLLSSNLEGLIMNTRSPRMWQCHVCNGGPHTYATTPACASLLGNRQCGHTMCTRCKKDGDIPNPFNDQKTSRIRV
jgi:tetratricopeptide (TPR) repeat protein